MEVLKVIHVWGQFSCWLFDVISLFFFPPSRFLRNILSRMQGCALNISCGAKDKLSLRQAVACVTKIVFLMLWNFRYCSTIPIDFAYVTAIICLWQNSSNILSTNYMFVDRASLCNLFQMKPARCTLLLSIFISTSVHVSSISVPIIRKTYSIYATLAFFILYGWLSGLQTRQSPIQHIVARNMYRSWNKCTKT